MRGGVPVFWGGGEGVFGAGDADETKQGAEDAEWRRHGDLFGDTSREKDVPFLMLVSAVAYAGSHDVG